MATTLISTTLSTTTLSTHLVTFGAALTPFTTKAFKGSAPMAPGYRIGNETYGRKSMVYIQAPDLATRHRLEKFLVSKGAKVDRSYSPSGSTTEVQVSYFKGWHWNE